MTLESATKLTDIVGEWRTVQKLLFVFVQFTFFVFGWQCIEMSFLMPQVKIYCQGPNSTNTDPCSDQCEVVRYEHKDFKSTLTEDLGLVCQQSWLQSFGTTILFMSGTTANLISGCLADRFGRSLTVRLAVLPYVLGDLLVLFSQNYLMFAFGQALVGIGAVTITSFSYLLLFELCGEKHRAVVGTSIELGFTFGAVALGAVSWALRNWFLIHIVNVGLVLAFGLSWFLPESTEWLLKKNRKEQAIKNIQKIIKVNRKPQMTGKEVADVVQELSKVDQSTAKHHLSYSFKDLFILSEFRFKTLCVINNWFSVFFIFYGVSLNVRIFGDHFFLNFIIASVSALPSTILTIIFVRFIKIKWILVVYIVIAGLAAFTYIIGNVVAVYKTVSVVVIWFCIAPCCIIIIIFTSQMYPTEVRGRATALGNFMGRLGSCLAPFAKELGNVTNDYVPMLLFGLLSTVQVILLIKLGWGTRQFDLSAEKSEGCQEVYTVEMSNDVQLVNGVHNIPVSSFVKEEKSS